MPEIKCPKCGTVFTVDENEYKGIVNQVRDEEFKKELKIREDYLRKENESKLKVQEEKANSEKEKAISELKLELEKARSSVKSMEDANKLAIADALKQKEKDLIDLKILLEKAKSENVALKNEKELEISKAVNEKEKQIQSLRNDLELGKKQAQLNIDAINKEHEVLLKQKDEQINFYKDLKAKASTKMIGENLEQHCLTEFNKIRATAFPDAYFEKDNEVIDHTKGDFIFRDYNDGIEYISIMFEMKNQNDDGDKKHKNEEFFDKLEEDRKKKNCDYAVLVSLLEPDNDLYNQGIVDVSYRHKNMYVIRPQFFIPMITLLRNAAIKNVVVKKELIAYQQQNIDIVNFDKNLKQYKEDFSTNVARAGKDFQDAINEIDKSINELTKTKENLLKSANQLRIADRKVQGITIKKLTNNAPSLRSAFDEMNKDEN